MNPIYRGQHRRTVTHATGRIMLYLLLGLGALVSLVPFAWMVSTSLQSRAELLSGRIVWIPKPPLWSNYADAVSYIPFAGYLANTAFVTVVSVAGALGAATLVAYGFARLRAPGKDFLFSVLLGSMMLPGQVTMIPVFILFRRLGWYNSFKALTLPSFLGGGAFNIFLLRQFFMTIPNELSEAAKIDGCSDLGVLTRMILPLSKPALSAVAVFLFVANWTDFMAPLIYLSDQSRYTLAVGLRLFQSTHSTEFSLLMAATFLFTLPIIIIFFLAQNYFVEGVTLTGIKG